MSKILSYLKSIRIEEVDKRYERAHKEISAEVFCRGNSGINNSGTYTEDYGK